MASVTHKEASHYRTCCMVNRYRLQFGCFNRFFYRKPFQRKEFNDDIFDGDDNFYNRKSFVELSEINKEIVLIKPFWLSLLIHIMASFTIQLNDLRFFANHGVYAEEKVLGNEFDVNISIKVKALEERITSIHQTINYAEVYRITKDVFSTPQPLLETVAQDIAEAIKQQHDAVKRVSIQITKLHPPITSFIGSVGVRFQKRYD